MEPIFAEVLEFRDRGRVVKTLQLIEGYAHTLTLSEPAAGWTLALDRLWVEEDEQTLVLEAAADAWADIALPTEGLALAATTEGETLAFDGIAPISATADADEGRRRFLIPERLRVENKRAGLRLTFVKGMSAAFEVRGIGDEPSLTADVIDLSIGGCQIELPVAAALTLDVDGAPLDVAIVFPNGDRFEIAATPRYIRVLGAGLARAGLAFEPIDEERRQRLWLWLHEIEVEIATRRGERSPGRQIGGLFRVNGERETVAERPRARHRPGYRSTMRRPLLEVARDLSRAALAVRAGQPLPAAALAGGAARLCRLLTEDRQAFLFGLASLSEQPPLIQHSLAVAGRLADLIAAEADLEAAPAEIALGALLHDLALVRLADHPAATLASVRHRPEVQSGDHVTWMLACTAPYPALATSVTHDLLVGLGPTPEAIDDGPHARIVRAARVVKAVDVRVRGYHGQPPVTAVDACRQLYRDRDRFDDYWVRRYIQRQGPYPIGTMVRYSHGFRAQVMALDERGQPACVRVLRNLKAAEHQRLNVVLQGVDLHQLGRLDRAMAHDPQELYAPPSAPEH